MRRSLATSGTSYQTHTLLHFLPLPLHSFPCTTLVSLCPPSPYLPCVSTSTLLSSRLSVLVFTLPPSWQTHLYLILPSLPQDLARGTLGSPLLWTQHSPRLPHKALGVRVLVFRAVEKAETLQLTRTGIGCRGNFSLFFFPVLVLRFFFLLFVFCRSVRLV